MKILDALAKRAGFAMTREAAARQMCCVRCALPVSVAWSKEDCDEWRISFLCPACYAAIMVEETE